jgi:hypothetical protein
LDADTNLAANKRGIVQHFASFYRQAQMRVVRSAATVIALIFVSPVVAEVKKPVSCPEFLARFEVANVANGGKLPKLQFEKRAISTLQIVNVKNIQAAIDCSRNGDFEGLGVSLLDTSDADVERFSHLLNAAILATDSGLDAQNAALLLKKLALDALVEAQRVKIESGRLYGSAEANLGTAYYISQTFTAGLVRASVSEKPWPFSVDNSMA